MNLTERKYSENVRLWGFPSQGMRKKTHRKEIFAKIIKSHKSGSINWINFYECLLLSYWVIELEEKNEPKREEMWLI